MQMGDFVPHSFFRRVTAVMKRIRYIEELNYFNGIACLLVILIHVLSLGVVSPEARDVAGILRLSALENFTVCRSGIFIQRSGEDVSDFFGFAGRGGGGSAKRFAASSHLPGTGITCWNAAGRFFCLTRSFFSSIMRPIGRQDCCSRPGMR